MDGWMEKQTAESFQADDVILLVLVVFAPSSPCPWIGTFCIGERERCG